MSAFNDVKTLFLRCADTIIGDLGRFESNPIALSVISSLSSNRINYLLERLIDEQTHDETDLRRVIEFIRIFGFKLTQINLSFKIRKVQYPVEMGQQILNTLSRDLNVATFHHLDIYASPLIYDRFHLLNLIRTLHNLVYLRLMVARLDDRLIEAVASHCANLRELHVLSTNFSDSALMKLAGVNENDYGRRVPGCLKLQQLIIYSNRREFSCQFGPNSISTLLLRLRELSQLQLPGHLLCETLALMTISGTLTQPLNLTTAEINFSLPQLWQRLKTSLANVAQYQSTLFSTFSNFPLDVLLLYLRALPKLNTLKVTLMCEDQLAHLLETLPQFGALRSIVLTINGSESEQAHHQRPVNGLLDQLLPKLNALVSIELYNLKTLDLSILGEACSNLENLQICNVERVTCARTRSIFFDRLQTLIIFGNINGRFDEHALLALLSAARQLRTLNISWCQAMNDDLMSRVLELNDLPHVRCLELHELSDNFTIVSIRHIVRTRVRPLLLSIFSCAAIEANDIAQLRSEIVSQNRNVIVKHYNDR